MTGCCHLFIKEHYDMWIETVNTKGSFGHLNKSKLPTERSRIMLHEVEVWCKEKINGWKLNAGERVIRKQEEVQLALQRCNQKCKKVYHGLKNK